MEQMKTYIKLRSALNHRELARLIDWSPSSFHQWLHGNRPIPKQKEYELESILLNYGYKGHN